MQRKEYIKNKPKNISNSGHYTLTICSAEASGGKPRQQSRDSSALIASHTPSLEMISRPPAEDNYMTTTNTHIFQNKLKYM